MADNIQLMLRKEVLNLRRVVKGSKLGKHITENILIPILERLEYVIGDMLDWIGWEISEQIKHILATTKPGTGWAYEVYYVDKSAPWGQKYTKIGEYNASPRGGPPVSDNWSDDPDIPQSGTLLSAITYQVSNGSVIIGIADMKTPYHLWYNEEWGKLFVSEETEPRSAMDYGAILDDPNYAFQRPYFASTIQKMKKAIRKRFREEFQKELNVITKRPTVKRAIEIHFRWSSSLE